MSLPPYYYKTTPLENMILNRNMDTVISDHSHQVYHFFDLYRTPFAVLCAASLYGSFQVTSRHRTDGKKGFEKFATRQCHIAFATPCMLSLVVLLISTMTNVTILRGHFDPKAESAYELIMREFKFEYVAIQWCCIVSIISLIRGAYLHVLLGRGLFHGHKEEFAMIVADLFSFVTGALAYINSSLYSWDSFYGMTCDLFKMIWHSYVDEQKPLKTLSFFSAGVTLGLFLKITIFNEEGILNKFIRESFGKKDEKNVSLGELKEEHSGKKKQ